MAWFDFQSKNSKLGCYLVIQMDPVASVAHLNDPMAVMAAAAMETKRYIVCIDRVSGTTA